MGVVGMFTEGMKKVWYGNEADPATEVEPIREEGGTTEGSQTPPAAEGEDGGRGNGGDRTPAREEKPSGGEEPEIPAIEPEPTVESHGYVEDLKEDIKDAVNELLDEPSDDFDDPTDDAEADLASSAEDTISEEGGSKNIFENQKFEVTFVEDDVMTHIMMDFGKVEAAHLACDIFQYQLAHELNDMKDELADLAKDHLPSPEVDTETIAQLQAQIDSLELENHDLKATNETLTKEYEELQDDYRKLIEQNGNITEDCLAFTRENEELKLELSGAEAKNAQLKKKARELGEQLISIKEQRDEFKQKLADAESKKDDWKHRLATISAQYDELKKRASQLEEQSASSESSPAETPVKNSDLSGFVGEQPADTSISGSSRQRERTIASTPATAGWASDARDDVTQVVTTEAAEVSGNSTARSERNSAEEAIESSRLPHPAVCYIDDNGMMHDRESWKRQGKPAWDREIHWRNDNTGEFSDDEVPADIAKRFRRGESFDARKDSDYADAAMLALRNW